MYFVGFFKAPFFLENENQTFKVNCVMPDIIFHIGLPKCASTTLQSRVFKNENGYLGTHEKLSYKKNYGLQFEQLTPTGPRLFGDFNGVAALFKKIKDDFSNDFNNQERFILSSELLSNRNKLIDRPIIPFLKKINDKLWPYGAVKVLLVVRNPAQRMVSEYVQISCSNPNASQNDLGDYLVNKMNDPRNLEYDKWVEELQQALGVKNVCVLFMEEINKEIFWDQLKSFCDLKKFDTKKWFLSNKRENTRKKDHNVWNLRPFSPQKKAFSIVSNVYALVWPVRLFKTLRSLLFRISVTLLRSYFSIKYKKSLSNERGTVALTPVLEKKINTYYKPQFERMDKRIDKDLTKLRYYVSSEM